MLKTPSETTGLKIRSQTLLFQTERGAQFIDITDRVVSLLKESGVENGFVVVFSKHTTAAITINENEPHLVSDMEEMLERLLPDGHNYAHNKYAHSLDNGNGERPNGHSHLQHLLLGASVQIPVVAGALTFGVWQRVFLVELDHAREREVVVQILGE